MQEYILLLSRDKSLILEKGKVHNTKLGVIDTKNIKLNDVIQLKDCNFVAVKPNVVDLLKKCKRGAQIVMPKDAGQISSITGLGNGWKCLDAGSGSGYLSIYLGNVVGKKGKVITYEKRKNFYEIAKRNIELCNLEKVVNIKYEDVRKFSERNLDLAVFDLKNSHTLVKKTKNRLRPGGWLVIYSPHIEAQIKALEEMKETNMNIYTTIETIQRKWKSNFGYTHPEPSGIIHTGFITFARKVL